MNFKKKDEFLKSFRELKAKYGGDDPRLPYLALAQTLKMLFLFLIMEPMYIPEMMRPEWMRTMAFDVSSTLLVLICLPVVCWGLFDRLMARVMKQPLLKDGGRNVIDFMA